MTQESYLLWRDNPHLDSSLKAELLTLTPNEIEDSFYRFLEFGTGGMRGLMGVGPNRLNIYTIRKATLGYANTLKAGDRVAIAYDSRHNSRLFAYEAARTLASAGIDVSLFTDLRPTPVLSFAVRHLQCQGGIVITASHNPPAYNGYKVYDEHGCQMVPHQVQHVIDAIDQIEDLFAIDPLPLDELVEQKRITWIDSAVDDAYQAAVLSLQLHPELDKTKLKIVYTPLHGAGLIPVTETLSAAGYTQVSVVSEQRDPDPDFTSVSYPNPEDPATFTLAKRLGGELHADLLLATDPDSDRVAMGVLNDEGEYTLLTGNQTGALLLYYLLSEKQQAGTVIDTIVTSNLIRTIAEAYGCEVRSVLTGFKYIGEQIQDLHLHNKPFRFGCEESCGYLIGDFVRDKDAVQAILLLAEAGAFYQQRGQSLLDVLNDIYQRFGYVQDTLLSFEFKGREGLEHITGLMRMFRENPPHEWGGIPVKRMDDYALKQSTDCINGEQKPLDLPKSDVLKYYLADGSWLVLRPSGTEPKIKVYIGTKQKSLEAAQGMIDQLRNDALKRIQA